MTREEPCDSDTDIESVTESTINHWTFNPQSDSAYDWALNMKTLLDVVNCPLPPVPPLNRRSPSSLSQTKELNKTERALKNTTDVLTTIVPQHNLVAQLFPHATRILQRICLTNRDPEVDALLHTIFPRYSSVESTTYINSEEDIARWVESSIFRPALLATKAALKLKSEMGDNIWNEENSTIYPMPNLVSENANFPHYGPAVPAKVIPDGVLVLGQGAKGKLIGLTAEYKTPAAVCIRQGKIAFGPLLEISGRGFDDGFAVKFKEADNSGDEMAADKDTRMICQVGEYTLLKDVYLQCPIKAWTQMVECKCNLSAFTWAQSTILCARGKGDHRQVLYTSPGFDGSNARLAVFAWFCIATGLIPLDKLVLQVPKTDHWTKGRDTNTGNGIVNSYVIVLKLLSAY